MEWLDRLVADCLAPLAVWVLASGLDDVFLDLSYIWIWIRAPRMPSEPPAAVAAAKRIAILVPCWREAEVIGRMLEHNLARLDYPDFDFWIGVYPNDPATFNVAEEVGARWGRIWIVTCPHPGPTTKADCLNWIYQGLLAEERDSGTAYDVVLQHDAEDLIDPSSLEAAARWTATRDMVQFPVLPVATPITDWTHGSYCDEFAEFHGKELPVRALMGGFVPSAGVGTAYRREMLEELRLARGGQLYDTTSLTEDYAMGFHAHQAGFSQMFWPAEAPATRGLFPADFGSAVRQRGRWLTGNIFQSWEKFGWSAPIGQIYWLWRDRKGLLGHPASILTNLVFIYGLLRWQSGFGAMLGEQSWLVNLLAINLALLVWRQMVRSRFVARVYGWKQALTVPLRAPWANLINFCALIRAIWSYWGSRMVGRPLKWAKTNHQFPVAKPVVVEGFVASSGD